MTNCTLPSQVEIQRGMKYLAAYVDVRGFAGFVKFAVQGANYRDRQSVCHTHAVPVTQTETG